MEQYKPKEIINWLFNNIIDNFNDPYGFLQLLDKEISKIKNERKKDGFLTLDDW